jgi:hypothetical protein
MHFDLQLLGKPDASGNCAVLESRILRGASVEQAMRMAKVIIQNTPVPGTYVVRLIRNGLEVFRCLMIMMSRKVDQAFSCGWAFSLRRRKWTIASNAS